MGPHINKSIVRVPEGGERKGQKEYLNGLHHLLLQMSDLAIHLKERLPCNSDGKDSACHPGDPGSIPGSGRSSGEESGNPLQFSCLENPHGQRGLVGFSPWDHKESGTAEPLTPLLLDLKELEK